MSKPGSLNQILDRLDRLESESAIRRLKAEYMRACDEPRGAAVADLFWPDGVWESVGGTSDSFGRLEGQGDIGDAFAANPSRYTFTTHYLTNESIEVDGDSAIGRWYLFEPLTHRGEQAYWMGGWYEDRFERRDGLWRFAHLRLSVTFRTPFDVGWAAQQRVDLP